MVENGGVNLFSRLQEWNVGLPVLGMVPQQYEHFHCCTYAHEEGKEEAEAYVPSLLKLQERHVRLIVEYNMGP